MTPRLPERTGGGRRGQLMLALTTIVFGAASPRVTAATSGVDERTLPASSKITEAGRHFRRGIELYDEGDLSAATVEFSRAYQIVPSFKILYNLGQIAYQRQDYATARDTFQRYLADGRDQIPADRKKQVEQDVRRLDQRIGQLEVETPEDGSEVVLDGVTVGTTPLWAIAANAGRRRLEVTSKAGIRQVRAVDIVAGETTHVKIGAVAAPRILAQSERSLAPKAQPLITPPSSTVLETRAERPEELPASPSSRGTWVAWSATGLLALGATVTGVLALTASRNLQEGRDTFPILPGSLDPYAHRARILAWTSDGLIAGTVLMAALSSYLTFGGHGGETPEEDQLGQNE